VQAPRSRAVFHAKDPINNRAFSLLDTEVTVARMLDGKRSVKDVIENAGKLGIEVNLESLQHFISHLKGYRFIDQDVEEGDSTWPKRKQWTEEERQLYQASMKMLREGHFAEALSFAESLEAADPSSEEAKQLKHRVEVEQEGVFELVAKFPVLHSAAPPVVSSKPALAEVALAPAEVANAPGEPGRRVGRDVAKVGAADVSRGPPAARGGCRRRPRAGAGAPSPGDGDPDRRV
jgi:hypothetical protein